jgi:hypothetical protein
VPPVDNPKAAVLNGKAKEREFCEKVQFMLSWRRSVCLTNSRTSISYPLLYLCKCILNDLGFVHSDPSVMNIYSNQSQIIKAVIAAGLYPQVSSIKMPYEIGDILLKRIFMFDGNVN